MLTDGSGLMNGSALLLIGQMTGGSSRPTAVQGRIAGSKGLWILHPSDRAPSEPPRIWIRDSQRKILLPPFEELDRSHRIFDLVAIARVTTPHRLGKQAIINLAHGGVPHDVFVDLMGQTLEERNKPLMQWDDPRLLWNAVYRAGNTAGVRLGRHANGLGRVLGVAGRHSESDSQPWDDIDDMGTTSGFIDGSDDAHQTGVVDDSSSLHEETLRLLQAGFGPLESPILNFKLQKILETSLQSCVQKYRITLPLSAGAFLIPGRSL